MENSFLEYYKLVLNKVSFDKNLFRKEYGKALRFLGETEKIKLNNWIKACGLHKNISEDENRKVFEVHTQREYNY